ncbi:hypothetical protein JTE90_000300 [Oedothorax gibbosus]|uniref:Uncharacterized protein n=1 Tax=Oedothorax gibbosus TaxID=931172 RepID=A0AAV6VRY2_9ARAC|nr:hypothetical protein JTE90_000300 [Oedothorax gibbosus]
MGVNGAYPEGKAMLMMDNVDGISIIPVKNKTRSKPPWASRFFSKSQAQKERKTPLEAFPPEAQLTGEYEKKELRLEKYPPTSLAETHPFQLVDYLISIKLHISTITPKDLDCYIAETTAASIYSDICLCITCQRSYLNSHVI